MADHMRAAKPPVVLCILDGWGWRDEVSDNAIRLARTPSFDRLWAENPHTLLQASGEDVGLPPGQIGNSEVGHMNLGAGRVVWQDLPRIDQAINADALVTNTHLVDFIGRLSANGGTCHLLGLASSGGVHAHLRHIAALAKIVSAAGVPVTIHAFTDGRDTPPRDARAELATLTQALAIPHVNIGTVIGRYWAMDRDNRWDRVMRAWQALVTGTTSGGRAATADEAIEAAYTAGVGDEFIEPTIIGNYPGMRNGDGILCANFRADRVREILEAILNPEFDGFPRLRVPVISTALGMVSYSSDLDRLMSSIFEPKSLTQVLGDVIAQAGRTQLRIAETEKYPHVTFFFNGGEEHSYPGEDRILVPSPKVATYDLQPEMSALGITEQLLAALAGDPHNFTLVNFANPDMVGHTGDLAAAIKAVETVDQCLGRLTRAVEQAGGQMIVTADHGNCEVMRDPVTGGAHTAHTLNPVPILVTGSPSSAARALRSGRLADVAPTVLALMGIDQPPDMTGTSLLVPAG